MSTKVSTKRHNLSNESTRSLRRTLRSKVQKNLLISPDSKIISSLAYSFFFFVLEIRVARSHFATLLWAIMRSNRKLRLI